MKIFAEAVSQRLTVGGRISMYREDDGLPSGTQGEILEVLPDGNARVDFGERGIKTIDFVKTPFVHA